MESGKVFHYRDHIDLVSRSSIKTLKETFNLNVTADKATFTDSDFELTDVSSTVSIVIDKMEATLAILFSRDTIQKMIMKIYRQPPAHIDKSVGDTTGEICNIIFCVMKQELNQKGFMIKTALPTVVVGREHRVSTYLQGSKFIIPFKSEFGVFHVSIAETKVK